MHTRAYAQGGKCSSLVLQRLCVHGHVFSSVGGGQLFPYSLCKLRVEISKMRFAEILVAEQVFDTRPANLAESGCSL